MQFSSNISKFVVSICYLLLLLSVIIVSNFPATSYEPSIYTSTPIIFWISIFISTMVGIGLVLFSDEKHSNQLILGLSLVFFSYVLCLSLFIIRGYYAWGINVDPSGHIGFIKSILNNGYTPDTLFYPITHVFSAEFVQITGINIIDLSKYLPLLFGILFVPFMYLFSRSLLKNKKEVILATVLSCAFIFGWYINFTPNCLANFYIPLVLMIIVKSYSDVKNRINWSILLVIMVFFFPPFHPVPTVFLLIYILAINIPINLLKSIPINLLKFIEVSNIRENIGTIKIRSRSTLVLLLSVFSIAWVSSFFIWKKTVKNLYTLTTEGGSTNIQNLADQVNYASGQGFNVYLYGLKMYGGILVILVLSLIGLYFVLRNRNLYAKKRILPLFGPLIVTILVLAVLYFFNIGFGPLRLIFYITLLGTVIAAYAINQIIKRNEKSRLKAPFLVVIFLVLSGVFVNGILILYPSPYTSGISLHTPQSEIEGMEWLFNNKNYKKGIIGISISPGRFYNFFSGDVPYSKFTLSAVLPPYHFGYENSSSLSSNYTEDKYLLITLQDRSLYTHVFPELANSRWTSSDFDKLETDNGLNEIYIDGANNIYYINARG